MRIVVIGGSGLIASKLVTALRANGHQAVGAPPDACFDALTGEGLAAVLTGADAVVDLTDPASSEDESIVSRFITAARTLLEYEGAAA